MATAEERRNITQCKDVLFEHRDQVRRRKLAVPRVPPHSGAHHQQSQPLPTPPHSLPCPQAQAPSKNFCQLVVNKQGAVFREWKINPTVALQHHGVQDSATERVVTLADFKDGDLHDKIEQSFGSDILDKAKAVCALMWALGGFFFSIACLRVSHHVVFSILGSPNQGRRQGID